jgi:hypothetical protein
VLVPVLRDLGRPVKANLSLDAGLLETIDAEAEAHGLTRSAFITSAAREKIAGEVRSSKPSRDRARVNASEDYEVRYWAKIFGVSKDQLKAAVKATSGRARDDNVPSLARQRGRRKGLERGRGEAARKA